MLITSANHPGPQAERFIGSIKSILALCFSFVPQLYKKIPPCSPSLNWEYLRLMVEPSPVRPRTGPRYEPRLLLKNPREFGKKLEPEFVAETGENSAQISGAMVQHVFAKGIREALMERGMSLLELSEWTGLNYQRLTRMLRGSVVMRIDDIGIFARHLPEAFDSSVGKYDPRARLNLANPTPSRLSRIYQAALPLGGPGIKEPKSRTEYPEKRVTPSPASAQFGGSSPTAYSATT